MRWFERYARYHGYKINPDVEQNMIDYFNLVDSRGEEHYCPSKSERNENTICPCECFRVNGVCDCKFFVNRD